jgi:hypothetical protein
MDAATNTNRNEAAMKNNANAKLVCINPYSKCEHWIVGGKKYWASCRDAATGRCADGSPVMKNLCR